MVLLLVTIGEVMDNTTTERQRKFKKRMYKAGFKQVVVWVKRKEAKTPEKMSISEFVRQLKKLTGRMDTEILTKQLNLFIEIIKAKKEEEKLKKNK